MSRPEKIEVDEGLIHAWLDGELSAEEAARVERLAATDAAWSAAVAEARGLIAASSRIVSALDAVPGGVLPAGTAAAPVRRMRVRPWMRMAAGMLLVAGTAYTVREVMTPRIAAEVDIAPTAQVGAAEREPSPQPSAAAEVSTVAPAAAPTVASSSRPSRGTVNTPVTTPATTPVSTLVDSSPRESSADLNAAPPVAASPPPAPLGQVSDAQKAELARSDERTAIAPTTQRARQERAPSTAPSRALAEAPRELAAAGASAAGPLRALEDCWRVTAPDSLAAVYRDLTILRQFGDTLVLVLPNATLVTVVRRDDTLRGALTAIRVSCPLESATTPRDSK